MRKRYSFMWDVPAKYINSWHKFGKVKVSVLYTAYNEFIKIEMWGATPQRMRALCFSIADDFDNDMIEAAQRHYESMNNAKAVCDLSVNEEGVSAVTLAENFYK